MYAAFLEPRSTVTNSACLPSFTVQTWSQIMTVWHTFAIQWKAFSDRLEVSPCLVMVHWWGTLTTLHTGQGVILQSDEFFQGNNFFSEEYKNCNSFVMRQRK